MLGYCCISLGGNSKFKTTTVKHTSTLSDPRNKLFGLFRHNLLELSRILDYNMDNNLMLYRISSSLFPLSDHPAFEQFFNEFASQPDNFTSIRNKIQEYLSAGGRLSTHPSQYCVISSANKHTNDNGIKNLEYHGRMFDLFGLPATHFAPINIHVSNGRKDCKETVDVVNTNLERLSDSVKSRLVFENEDGGGWTIEKLVENFKLPVTFDMHHHRCNGGGLERQEAMAVASRTWDVKPLFHISSGKDSQTDKSHHDWLLDEDVEWVTGQDYDWDVEVKKKDLAVLKIYTPFH